MTNSARGAKAAGKATHQSLTRSAQLRWRIVTLLAVAALIPLAVVGIGGHIVYSRLLERKSLDLQKQIVRGHAATIDQYLRERVRALGLLTETYALDELGRSSKLRKIFGHLQASYDSGFLDLGVIDGKGGHLAYIGPYDLADKNYANAEWFRHVMTHGVYVSDVFLGYRKVPHCVIAVKRMNGDGSFILRATINSQHFESVVRSGLPGSGWYAYIVNEEGRYQTTPQSGNMLDRTPMGKPQHHQGLQLSRVSVEGVDWLQTTVWLNDGRWMLVVRQSSAAIREPLRHAMVMGILVSIIGMILLAVIATLATLHLTRRIDRAKATRDQLSRQLVRSAKLASVGELATGLAHEINNPLAIISSERTNLSDLIGDLEGNTVLGEEMRESTELIRRQVERCAGITAKMLQFGRKGESAPELIDIRPRVREVVGLLRRQAEVSNVRLELALDEDLPAVVVDRTELEQVLVNLITNSLHSMENGGTIQVGSRQQGQNLELTVSDTGAGIPQEDLERVFQPFFTTKPVGKGTGLGLSVCFGIVHGWGGHIVAESALGQGTTMRILIPVPFSEKGEGAG